MMEINKEKAKNTVFYHEKGITYFDKRAERVFFFILTIFMLICGILVKMGLL